MIASEKLVFVHRHKDGGHSLRHILESCMPIQPGGKYKQCHGALR